MYDFILAPRSPIGSAFMETSKYHQIVAFSNTWTCVDLADHRSPGCTRAGNSRYEYTRSVRDCCCRACTDINACGGAADRSSRSAGAGGPMAPRDGFTGCG